MRKAVWIGCMILCCLPCLHAQEDYALGHVIEEIYKTALEAGATEDFEQLQEELLLLSRQKININQATAEQLEQLYFLDDEQIDRILLYRDEHPLHNIYELQLIPGLREWEYRYLALFVEAGPVHAEPIYVRDLFRVAKHEVNLRVDGRQLEGFTGDPVYTSVKYQFGSMNRLQFGLTAERDPGEPWWGPRTMGFDHYGGHLQINDLWRFKTIVAGDYRAHYGLGLVVNGSMRLGKSSYISNLNFGGQGLRKYSSTGESGFYRGAGATLRWGDFDASVWYSFRMVDANLKNGRFPSIITTGYHRTPTELSHKRTVGQHVIGANLTYRFRQLRLGITAQEMLLSDTLRPTSNYYNTRYFSGKRQATIGAYAFWRHDIWQVFGEVATSQNRRWGVGAIAGTKVEVTHDVQLLALGRYYSPWFDNLFAGSFGETSRNNDELGLFVGTEVLRWKQWRLGAYADVFHFFGPKFGSHEPLTGVELQADAGWKGAGPLGMEVKLRWKRKKSSYLHKCQARYLLQQHYGNWRLETALEGSLCTPVEAGQATLGGMVRQDVSYTFEAARVVLQARVEWFDVQQWNNRLYAYENDVLYAFSIPAVYGQGGRWYVNARWQINDHFGLYLKTAQTIYTRRWMTTAGLSKPTRTDVHLLLRITY